MHLERKDKKEAINIKDIIILKPGENFTINIFDRDIDIFENADTFLESLFIHHYSSGISIESISYSIIARTFKTIHNDKKLIAAEEIVFLLMCQIT